MDFFRSIGEVHPRRPILQKEDFICSWVSVHVDFASGLEILSNENQMLGTTILRIDFQDKALHGRASKALDDSPLSPLAFVLLENEWRRFRRIGWLPGSVRQRSGLIVNAKQN
jgi:hypothetical protein